MKQQNLFDRRLHGLLAEFATPDQLLRASRRVYEEGYRRIDAYSPVPVHGLAEAMGFRRNLVPLVVLIAAVCGGIFGYWLQYFMAALSYVHNVGGRPIHSWPSFVPVTFELTVLTASVVGVIGMFAMNGLPRPYHPVFNAPRFDRASQDRYFLSIEAVDPKFDLDATRDFLYSLDPYDVVAVDA
jgi:Protein of unknown function (DUF3341)